jgi:hypothetical protein
MSTAVWGVQAILVLPHANAYYFAKKQLDNKNCDARQHGM